ncbi:PEP-CTERM sorting domain-containing protein [Luteolibacter sp. SL250]|uniref:PEP-CTERM sorting domain-containing protein n=1 Tax=Luteolibacter sp. SL250 TaxID=2995170 RepID=UPI00226ECBC2|nr:PEP-CTERM sorting domain-containing protein [Luteolibacter sp. SL250]WAC21702.1 PEP-CTERM sorting domain-containing protein [Luteolibacter sp. SL250]
MRLRSTSLFLSAGLGFVLALSSADGAIVAGNLTITQNDIGNSAAGVSGAFGYAQGGITYAGGNRGDYAIRFGGTSAAAELSGGIMIVSIAENGRSNEGPMIPGATPEDDLPAIGPGRGYATASIQPSGGGYASATFIGPTAISSGAKAGDEWNVNQAVGYFKYTEFIGGWLNNAGNNDPITSFRSSYSGLTAGSGATNTGGWTVYDGTANAGVYNVNLTGFNAPGSGLPATSQNGILLVVGGKNEANHASSRANEDGTFNIIVRSSDSGNTENDPAAFVYIPTGQEGVVAMGRVDGAANVTAGSGIATVTKGTTGKWLISTTGYDPTNSVLLISAEGDVGTNNGDNIYSYAYDPETQRWVVEGRDLQTLTADPTLQNIGTEPAFSFALISNQVPEPSTALLGALAGLGLLVRRRRQG